MIRRHPNLDLTALAVLVAVQVPAARYTGAVGEPAWWLAQATGRPAVAVRSSDLPRLGQTVPDDLVLVGTVRCVAGRNVSGYAFQRAAEVGTKGPVVEPC